MWLSDRNIHRGIPYIGCILGSRDQWENSLFSTATDRFLVITATNRNGQNRNGHKLKGPQKTGTATNRKATNRNWWQRMWPFRSVAIPVCGHFGLWPFWFVAVPVCGLFGLWPFRFVAVSVCGRFGLWPFRLWPFRFVAVMTCYPLTVPLHNSNGRQMPAVKALHGDCETVYTIVGLPRACIHFAVHPIKCAHSWQ